MGTRRPPEQVAVVRAPDVSLSTVANAAAGLAARHPVVSVSWVVGLLLAILATGFTPEPMAVQRYTDAVSDLRPLEKSLLEAQYEYDSWSSEYYGSKGWFGRCDDRCQANHTHFVQARGDLRRLQGEYDTRVAEAKSHLGLFSTLGVAEARDLFWRRVSGGKEFARRSTFYDALFAGIGSMRRDASLFEYAMTVFMHMIWNITLGAIGALVTFLWSVWGVISSFQPSAPVALAFFGCALLAAGSVVATFFLGLGAAGAGAVVGMVTLAKNQMALEAEQRRANDFLQQPQWQDASSGGARPRPYRPHAE